MELTPDNTTGSNLQGRCKSVMNALRRVLTFRDKRPTEQEDAQSPDSGIEMAPLVTEPPQVESPPSSEIPSTSASCSQPRAPIVYEDPFVAVAANGKIFIKHYYNFQSRAEFHLEGIRHGHVKRNSRIIHAKDIVKVYYAPGETCTDETVCKSWGICINDVWWASHLNRMEGANTLTNVVLIDDSVMHAGFSVVNIEAFAEIIQCVGLPREAPFQRGLPNPPFNLLKIPFIDDDFDQEETVPRRRRPRRHSSRRARAENPMTTSDVNEITQI